MPVPCFSQCICGLFLLLGESHTVCERPLIGSEWCRFLFYNLSAKRQDSDNHNDLVHGRSACRAGLSRPKQTAAKSGYVRPYASTLGDAFHQLVEVPVDQRDRISEAQEGKDRRQFTEWFSRIEQNDDKDQIQG